jgi:3-dehydroquinate dehydratase/shikimate dehydrogenase
LFMGDFLSRTRTARVCVTVGGPTMTALRAARDEAAPIGDLVELRLDSVVDPDAAGALQGRTGPVVVTCRPTWEGGAFSGSEEERFRLLTRAWDLGAEYVDIEARATFAGEFLVRTGGQRVVLSSHDFDALPADLDDRMRALLGTSAAVVKLAVPARRLRDILPVFQLHRLAGARPFVALAMGEAGVATRVLAARVGSCWTYAGSSWAPGQMSVPRLLQEFGFRRIGPQTAIFGVLGRPIAHSLSPAMHNASFAATGTNAVYLPFEAESVDDFLTVASSLDVQGASITAPYKVAMMPHVEADAVTRRVGAVNTLRRSAHRWEATNTDVEGFLAPLERRIPLAGARAAVLGAGGAARAIALALHDRGARVTVYARQLANAERVAASIDEEAAVWPPEPGSWDLLVNATPVGTSPAVDETPIPDVAFDGRLVYDLVYNPPETRLMREAAAAGCIVLGGLDMLVAQAQAQQFWWTGHRPDAAPMHAAALDRLGVQRVDSR